MRVAHPNGVRSASRRRTSRTLGVWCCGLVMAASSHAADLFRPCDTIEADKSFEALSGYFAGHPRDPEPLYCLALSRDAFVFTHRANFQDCRPASGSNGLACRVPNAARTYPDLNLLASFSGDGRSFALFHSEGLRNGGFGEGYEVFYLVPRHVDARGYRILHLEGAGAYDQSEGQGRCATAADLQGGQTIEDVVTAGTPPFEILHDGRSDVTIRFNQRTVRCGSGEVVDDTIAYRWSGDHFAKVVAK